MADPTKRVNYFDHQFLRVEDFTCEQEYHVARRRLHNRVLHTLGIAQGLEVEYEQRPSKVTIRPGTAVDSKGREIVLVEEQDQPLPKWNESQEYWLTIAYHERTTDPTEETGAKGDTRWMETPVIEWSKDREQKVVLAHICRSDDKVTVDSSENVRTVAGAKLGDTTARKLTVTGNVGIGTAEPKSPLSVSGGAAIGSGYADKKVPDNGLVIQGNVGIGTAEPKSPLSVSGGVAIGADYAAKTAPANGLIVQGSVGIGTEGTAADSLTINASDSARPRVIFQRDGKDSWDIGVDAKTGDLFLGDFTAYRMRLNRKGDLAFTGTIEPHYDSGWIKVPSGTGEQIGLTHKLGVYPGLIQILTKSNHDKDGDALKDHDPDAIKVSQINSDSFEQRCPAGFGVREITKEAIILVRGGHIWHGKVAGEYFNEGWMRVFMWKLGKEVDRPT